MNFLKARWLQRQQRLHGEQAMAIINMERPIATLTIEAQYPGISTGWSHLGGDTNIINHPIYGGGSCICDISSYSEGDKSGHKIKHELPEEPD